MRRVLFCSLFLTLLGGPMPAQVAVQFGDTTASTAFTGLAPFMLSYDFPNHPDHEFFTFPATPFLTAIGGTPYGIQLDGFQFFSHLIGGKLSAPHLVNIYDVYMTTGGTGRTHFGTFGLITIFDPSIGQYRDVGVGAAGTYTYNPALGDLGLEFVETADLAANTFPVSDGLWYDRTDDGDRRLVSRFRGTIATPEPATATLVATGLAAAAGVGAVRRRRKGKES